jgi:hypothetical protein
MGQNKIVQVIALGTSFKMEILLLEYSLSSWAITLQSGDLSGSKTGLGWLVSIGNMCGVRTEEKASLL